MRYLQVASHVHDVFGGSGFSANYDSNNAINSDCTTVVIPQDKSNYWVVSHFTAVVGTLLSPFAQPAAYYVNPNGSYTLMRE